MKLNKKVPEIHTHEGAVTKHINPYLQLRRSVMSCMLWEGEFYEDGQTIADRIASLIKQVTPDEAMSIAIEAREQMKLRHVPLLIAREMARIPTHNKRVAITLEKIIQRPDELTEFLAMYWRPKKQPLTNQVKKGLAAAFGKFTEYSLAKYNQQDKAIKLRDVLFMVHANPKDEAQAALWKRLVNKELQTPDTWEVALSATKGENKKEEWTRLLTEKKLGGLALLRNLRNLNEAKVDEKLIKEGIKAMKIDRILPFRFISAAKHAPQWEPELEETMFRCLSEMPKLPGKTCLLVDVSGSMDASMTSKSDLNRIDAACALAMLLREICESVGVATFSDRFCPVPPRRGFALRDAILTSQAHSGTDLARAIADAPGDVDRLICITDEQSMSAPKDPSWKKSYLINVASAKNGVGYGKWTHIDGFSEAIVSYIQEFERIDAKEEENNT